MSREYMCLYHSWQDTGALLTDEEFGRLARGALKYSADGTIPDLPGNEKYLFPTIKWQIDRDKQYYEESSNRRREAGRKGGTAKASNASKRVSNPSIASNASGEVDDVAPLSNSSITITNTNTKTNTNISTTATEADLSACVQCFEQNIGAISRAVFDDMRVWLGQLPADLVCEAIAEAAKSNKRNWNYIKAILKRCVQQNVLTVDAYRTEKQNRASAVAAKTSPSGRTSKQASIREALKKRLDVPGGGSSDQPGDDRLYAETHELVAESFQGQ